MQEGNYGDEFQGKEDEDLRLTSTDDDEKIKDACDGDRNKEDSDDNDNKLDITGRQIKEQYNNESKIKEDTSKNDGKQNGKSKSNDLYENLPKPEIQDHCEDEDSDDSTSKSRKKKKRDKKDKKKKKKKEREKDREDKDDLRRKKRELATQISLAKKIADKEKRNG